MSIQEPPIPLESYAAVIAGLGAGLPLVRALDLAGVRPADWDAGSNHWQSAIDESAASDLTVLVAFDAALLAARRRFEPTFEPIASDALAWAQFRRHFATAVDPPAFLAEKGLSLALHARMEADWVNKLAEDEALAAAFARHMESPLAECPALTVTPPALLRADAAKPLPAEEEEAPRTLPIGAPSVPAALPPTSVPVRAPALPFGLPSQNPPSVAPIPISSAPKKAPAAPLDSTGELPKDLIARIAKGQLPFARNPAATAKPPPPPAQRSAPPGFASSPSAQRPPPPAQPPAGDAVPGTPALTPAAPALTIEQYASLCAELAVSPAASDAIFTRHGLASLRERLTVDLAWRERLRTNPQEYKEWQAFYQRYHAYWADPARRRT